MTTARSSPAANAFQSVSVAGETTVVGTGVVVVVVVVTAVLVVVGGTVVVVVAVVVLVLVVVVAGSLVLDEVVVPPELCRLAPQAVARAAKPPIAPTRSNRRRLSCPDIPPSRYASGR